MMLVISVCENKKENENEEFEPSQNYIQNYYNSSTNESAICRKKRETKQ